MDFRPWFVLGRRTNRNITFRRSVNMFVEFERWPDHCIRAADHGYSAFPNAFRSETAHWQLLLALFFVIEIGAQTGIVSHITISWVRSRS